MLFNISFRIFTLFNQTSIFLLNDLGRKHSQWNIFLKPCDWFWRQFFIMNQIKSDVIVQKAKTVIERKTQIRESGRCISRCCMRWKLSFQQPLTTPGKIRWASSQTCRFRVKPSGTWRDQRCDFPPYYTLQTCGMALLHVSLKAY